MVCVCGPAYADYGLSAGWRAVADEALYLLAVGPELSHRAQAGRLSHHQAAPAGPCNHAVILVCEQGFGAGAARSRGNGFLTTARLRLQLKF